MKIFSLLLFAVFISAISGHASENSSDPPSKIGFTRHAPIAVKQQLPKGVRSYFWGTFRFQAKGMLYGVCLYDPNWKRNQKVTQWGGSDGFIWLTADIFSSVNNWQRIRRCKLHYHGYIDERMQVSTELLWLRPKKRQNPILKFTIFSYEPNNHKQIAGAGHELLLIFPKDLYSSYAVQAFSIGYWRASDTLGQSNFYDGIDSKGLMRITSQQSLNDDIWKDRTTIFNWKPQFHRFRPAWSRIYGGFGKPQIITNPKQLAALGL